LAEELKATNASADPELVARPSRFGIDQGSAAGEQHIQNAIGAGIAQADRGSTATVSFVAPPPKKDSD